MGVQTAQRYRYTQLSRYLAICGILAPVAVITTVIVGASLTPGYNHISDTISKLASPGMPHPEWMNAGFVLYGILMIGFSVAIRQCLVPRRGNMIVWLMIIVHGVGIILAAVFPYDLSIIEGINSFEGILHHLVAIISSVAFIIGILVMARMVTGEPAWRTTVILSLFAVTVVSVLFVVSLFPITRDVQGALQRTSAFAMIIYIEALSIRCLTLPHSPYRQS